MEIGYALSSEEHRPSDLVAHAVAAERAGFPFALISKRHERGERLWVVSK
jgi:hypothetical protein